MHQTSLSVKMYLVLEIVLGLIEKATPMLRKEIPNTEEIKKKPTNTMLTPKKQKHNQSPSVFF